MSQFYGTLNANNGGKDSTKRGHKGTGLTVNAAGWKGAVRITLSHNESTGNDEFTVELVPWKSSSGDEQMLARGVLDASAQAEGLAIVAPENWAELQELKRA